MALEGVHEPAGLDVPLRDRFRARLAAQAHERLAAVHEGDGVHSLGVPV